MTSSSATSSLAKRYLRLPAGGFDAAALLAGCEGAGFAAGCWLRALCGCAAGGRTVGRDGAACGLMLAAPNGTSCWMALPCTRFEFESGAAGVRFSYAPHPMPARIAIQAAATNARLVMRLLSRSRGT